jgi:microcystin-dependent protein
MMAGSIPMSGQQQLDSQGRPLSGGKFYTFVAGTSTPLTVYQDSALTVVHPNPLTLDASGRIPILYAPDGSLKFRLADQAGVTVFAADNVLVIGPSSGAAPPPGVDPTTVLSTGDVKCRYTTATLAGWVRLNGRSIGSATSGATERANADCQSLFEFLWTVDANLAVSGGRGASAAADFAANKTIALPDGRGRVLAALDDMGAAAAGRLTATYFGASGTVLGNAGGGESIMIAEANLPTHTHSFSATTSSNGDHTHFVINNDTNGGWPALTSGNSVIKWSGQFVGSGNEAQLAGSATTPTIGLSSTNGAHTHTVSGTSGTGSGSGTAHKMVQPTILITYYIKL